MDNWPGPHHIAATDATNSLEKDNWGSVPQHYRQLELTLDGVWAIRLHCENYSTVAVLRIIRRRLALSLAETSEVRNQLPGPILSGTRGEMETVAYELSASGITAEIVPAS